MPTLELTLQRKTDSGYPVIAALTRPGGFLPLRREGMLNLDIAALAELQYDPLAYGTALGQALFVNEIRDTFREGLAGGEALRVLLSVEAPDLRTLDWHRLAAPFDGRWRFLASQQNTPFSLSIPSPASGHFPALGRRDLRALVLVAGPESLSGDYKLAPFDVPATLASIQTALGDIPCDILSNPSLDALCATLTSTPYTFLHLVCHGTVNERGETILYFPKDERRTPTSATDLLDRLGSLAHLPHFAFISACESALPQNGLGSLAGRLVRELGLPAVLAMIDRVSIATASAIAAPFYAHLYQHGQPDLALAQSLAGLQGAHDLTVPAIFSRLGDCPLFDDNSERALTEKELEFGLAKLAESLPERAPVMDGLRDSLARRLRATLGAEIHSLSESSRTERKGTLDQLNSLSLEALDLSFNALCLGQTPPTYDSRSPFRGLESFRPEDAPYFFGREALTRKLVQKLNEHNFLAVLGASGSGKSSLVMAGLIPALDVPYAIFRPGAEPLSELEKALQADPQLLVVDQFEELFTLSAREQRSEFIPHLLEQSQRIRVVITLRADFLGEVAPFKSLKDEVQNHQEIIPPMDEAELRRAMEGQAGCAGLRFESDLSQQMLDDVASEPGAMPLLQHALWTLWTRRHGRWLRAEEYRAFGGVKQAIASTAEAVYARCTDFEKERLRDIFLRLTRLDEGIEGRDTRHRVLLRDLIPADSDPAATTLLIKQLADARLVVVTGDEVEVAHEALIRHWERLRAWLNDDRDNLRLREGVSVAANAWDAAPTNSDLLVHRGGRLDDAVKLQDHLNEKERTYLKACEQFIKQEQIRRERLRKQITSSLAVGFLIMLGIAIFASWQWQRAELQTKVAFARQFAAQAQALFVTGNSKQLTAVLLAIQSMRMFPTSDVAQILQNNTLAHPIAYMTHGGEVNSLAFSPSGKYIVSGGCNQEILFYSCTQGSVHVWEADTGKEVSRMNHDGNVYSVAFSPNGEYVVSGSDDSTARVWGAISGEEIARMTHNSVVVSVDFSPNSQYIVSGSADGIAIVWEAKTGKEITHMIHDSNVYIVAFSPDGKYVVSGSNDKTVRVWNAISGKEISRMSHDGAIYSVAFSPNGKYIVSGSADNTVRIWDILTGIEIAHMTHKGEVHSVAFSPNGNYVVSGSMDNTARVWDAVTGKEIARMTHDDSEYFLFCRVAFSPNGQFVVSGCEDGTARVWNAMTGKEVVRINHNGAVSSVAFSPDGKKVVSGSWDNSVRVWNALLQKEAVRINHGSGVSVNISPQSNYIVSSGETSKTAQVWEITTGKEIAHINNNGFVCCAVFSSDGKYVVSGSSDKTVKVWNALTGKEVSHMTHDDEVYTVAFSPDGKYVVSGGKDGMRVWSTLTGDEVVYLDRNEWVISVFFSPDGKYIAMGSVSIMRIWETQNWTEVHSVDFDNNLWSIAFSPDGKFITTGSGDMTVRIWEVATGKEIVRMAHESSVRSVTFSGDGKYVVSGSDDKTARVWESTTGKEIARLTHEGAVNSVAFSPDSKYVVSGSTDSTARVWEVTTGKEIARMVHEGTVNSVTFSPNSKYVVSAECGPENWNQPCSQSSIRVWIWNPDDLIAEACSRVTRNLTRAEWQLYISDALPYQAVCPNLPIEPEPTFTPTP